MLQSIPSFRRLTFPALLLPLALLGLACSDSTETTQTSLEGGANSDGGGNGGTGNTGASGSEGGVSNGDATNGSSGPDTTAPTVLSNQPLSDAADEAIFGAVTATFSEDMKVSTLAGSTFGLKQGVADVSGAVSYFNRTVTFVPAADLALNTEYTATITTAAEDLAGNALEAAYSWTFTTDDTAPIGPAPVLLGAAGQYAILAKSAVTNVPTSVVTGNIGLSPAAASYITGFALTKAGTKWTSPQVVGNVFAADNDPPTPSDLTTAVSNMQTAYVDAAGRPTPTSLNLGAGAIGGLTITPGLYKWTSTVTVPTDVTISGAPNDTWIFQITGDLKMSADTQMTLEGGAQAKNIVWQVAGLVNLGTGAHAEGIMLSKTAIKLGTGATVNGRLLAQTAVNIAGSKVKAP